MTIELACSHNQGRSVIAQAFAQKYSLIRGLPGLEFISSGTHVEEINNQLVGNIAYGLNEINWLISKGIERNIIAPEFGNQRPSENDPNYEEFQDIARKVMNQFVAEEHGYRADAFKIYGLGEPKDSHDQTIASPDVFLFLGMGAKNVETARKIYGGRNVTIDTLAGYASRQPGKEFPSAFGGDFEDYMKMTRTIRYLVHESIDRLKLEYDALFNEPSQLS